MKSALRRWDASRYGDFSLSDAELIRCDFHRTYHIFVNYCADTWQIAHWQPLCYTVVGLFPKTYSP